MRKWKKRKDERNKTLIYSFGKIFLNKQTNQKTPIWLTSIAEHSQHLGQKESHVKQVCVSVGV